MIFLDWEGGRADPRTWMTVTQPAVYMYSFQLSSQCKQFTLPQLNPRNNVQSNTKSVQFTDCLKVQIMECYHIKHTHIPQMPISAQQWRVSVGRANASRSLRPHVTGQPKMKLTSWDVLLFILTVLLGTILLSADGGRGTGERSE